MSISIDELVVVAVKAVFAARDVTVETSFNTMKPFQKTQTVVSMSTNEIFYFYFYFILMSGDQHQQAANIQGSD
jgi:hypothetical protein